MINLDRNSMLLYETELERLKDKNEYYNDDRLISLLNKSFSDLQYYQNLNIESVDGIISRIVDTIINTFGRLINNFRTIITKAFVPVKRSELKAYIQSHLANVHRIYKSNYTDLINIKVMTFPFRVSPLELSHTFNKFYKNLNISKSMSYLYKELKKIINSILDKSDSKIVLSDIKHFDSDINVPLCKNIMKYLLTNVILTPDELETRFGNVFSSMNEMKEYEKNVLMYIDKVYNDAIYSNSMAKKCDKILTSFENKLNSMRDYINNNKDSFKQLAETINDFGYLLETIGTFTKETNHSEHWLVDAYQTLYVSISK